MKQLNKNYLDFTKNVISDFIKIAPDYSCCIGIYYNKDPIQLKTIFNIEKSNNIYRYITPIYYDILIDKRKYDIILKYIKLSKDYDGNTVVACFYNEEKLGRFKVWDHLIYGQNIIAQSLKNLNIKVDACLPISISENKQSIFFIGENLTASDSIKLQAYITYLFLRNIDKIHNYINLLTGADRIAKILLS